MLARPADNLGPTPGLCLCMIVDRHNADPIGGYPSDVNYAVAFTYDVLAQTPNGPVPFNGVTPCIDRWERPWLVKALPLAVADETTGKVKLRPGAMMDGQFYLLVTEERWAAPCNWTPGTGGAAPASSDTTAPPPLHASPAPLYPGANP